MKHLFFFYSFFALLFLSEGSFAFVSPSSPLQIQGRQLLVDGKPFIIKAVCYNPVPKGKNPDKHAKSALTCKLDPTPQQLERIEGDFKLMHEAGINTIRVYKPITNKEILKKCDFYNIKVIVPVFTSYRDLEDHSSHKNLTITQETIRQLKDEKSTLFWEIGNEWNYNFFYSKKENSSSSSGEQSNGEPLSDTKLTQCIQHLEAAIKEVRNIDTDHPISTCLGDIPFKRRPDDGALDLEDLAIESFWKRLPNDQIDIYGVNIYDGKSFNATWDQDGVRVPTRFERWQKITQPIDQGGIGPKPLYISEYGATAYNLKKNGVPPFANYEDLKQAVLAIDNYRLYNLVQGMPLVIKKLTPDYDGQPSSRDGEDHPYFSVFNVAFDVCGEDEAAQAEGVASLAAEIHENLSAKDPNNFLLGGAVFEFCDEWWKAPDLSTEDRTDPWVHNIRGFANTDCRNTNMVCGGPWPDGYFHEEWFGLCSIDRTPRLAYYQLKEIYMADDDNGATVQQNGYDK